MVSWFGTHLQKIKVAQLPARVEDDQSKDHES